MQTVLGEEISEKTKYIISPDESCQFEISRMYDDCRMASEYEADQWVEDIETLFTLPEILNIFDGIFE